jgi:hypothetical protein
MFVPTGSYHHASPAAMELGQKLTDAIRQYQQSHPGVSATEIRGAIRMAEANTCSFPIQRAVMKALTLGAVMLGFVLFARQMDRGGRWDTFTFLPLIGVALIAGLFVAVKFARRQ